MLGRSTAAWLSQDLGADRPAGVVGTGEAATLLRPGPISSSYSASILLVAAAAGICSCVTMLPLIKLRRRLRHVDQRTGPPLCVLLSGHLLQTQLQAQPQVVFFEETYKICTNLDQLVSGHMACTRELVLFREGLTTVIWKESYTTSKGSLRCFLILQLSLSMLKPLSVLSCKLKQTGVGWQKVVFLVQPVNRYTWSR